MQTAQEIVNDRKRAEAYARAIASWRERLKRDPRRLAEIRFAKWRAADMSIAACYFARMDAHEPGTWESEADANLDVIEHDAGYDRQYDSPVRGTGPVADALRDYLEEVAQNEWEG